MPVKGLEPFQKEGSMATSYIMTAFGKDRPGIVADVAQVLYENGCNLEDSTMTLLADEFTLILLFTTGSSEDTEDHLLKECRRLEREKGVSAFLRPVSSTPAAAPASFSEHTLHVEGVDKAGIVYKVSRFLADNKLNIVDLVSRIEAQPNSGTQMYIMDIQVQVPEGTNMEKINAGLALVGEVLNVDIAFTE
jgi:glycine cleavage system transcriptional repressor